MPHCVLEYSANVQDNINCSLVLKEINQALAETGLFKIKDIKSRVYQISDYCVGDGNKLRGFAALRISIFGGRDAETRLMITKKCMEVLKPHFQKSLQNLKFDITIQLDTLDKESYIKLSSDSEL